VKGLLAIEAAELARVLRRRCVRVHGEAEGEHARLREPRVLRKFGHDNQINKQQAK